MKNVGDWVTVGEPIMHVVGLDKVKVKGFVFVSGDSGAGKTKKNRAASTPTSSMISSRVTI